MYIPLTAEGAKDLLLAGDLVSLYNCKPLGVSIEEVVKAALDIAHPSELDRIGSTNAGLRRRAMFLMPDGKWVPEETDGEFRERLKRYASSIAHIPAGGVSYITLPSATPRSCQHAWKTYVGLNQTFDYCTACDEKRNS